MFPEEHLVGRKNREIGQRSIGTHRATAIKYTSRSNGNVAGSFY